MLQPLHRLPLIAQQALIDDHVQPQLQFFLAQRDRQHALPAIETVELVIEPLREMAKAVVGGKLANLAPHFGEPLLDLLTSFGVTAPLLLSGDDALAVVAHDLHGHEQFLRMVLIQHLAVHRAASPQFAVDLFQKGQQLRLLAVIDPA